MLAAIFAMLTGFILLNAAGFVLIFSDHKRAYLGRRRISETTLLNIALLGGWLGCLTGTAAFRHKTRKQPFVTLLALATFANITGSAAILNWIHVTS
jgi:uncharacterized membrane protein YsdA (DUF1294 family)